MLMDQFSPSAGVVVGTDPAAKSKGPTPIPTDSLLILGLCHPATSTGSVQTFTEVDQLLKPDALGPIDLAFQVADILPVLAGDPKRKITAQHSIRSVKGFALMNTLVETTGADAEGLSALPLIATVFRLHFVKDFPRPARRPRVRRDARRPGR